MAIRSAARGLVIRDEKVLLSKSVSKAGKISYTIPGGGQNQYEPLVEAVVREVREESGYEVWVGRLVAVCEGIFLSPRIREKYPDYAHRVHHIFLCTLKSDVCGVATEPDINQEGCVWMPLAEADALDDLHPHAIRGKITRLAKAESCEFFGCTLVSDW